MASTLHGVTLWSIDNEYYLSQAVNRHLPVAGIKAGLLGLHMLLYITLVVAFGWLAMRREWLPWILFTITPLLALGFLTVVFREIEQRYMLPFLPLIFVAATLVLAQLLTHWTRKDQVHAEGPCKDRTVV